MDEFIILKRIGKNNDKYLLSVFDLKNDEVKYVTYCRRNENVIEEIIHPSQIENDNFVDYYFCTPLNLGIDDLKAVKCFDINNTYKIHKFNYISPISLRSMNYSIKKIIDPSSPIFVPCCGKHKDHDEIKNFGKYTNKYEFFENFFIEGYLIINPDLFDKYILKIDLSEIVFNFTDNKEILFRELKDFIKDFFSKEYDHKFDIKVSHSSSETEFKITI